MGKKKHISQVDKGDIIPSIAWVCAGVIAGIIAGIFLGFYADDKQMHDYDLYNCIYNNAASNDFPKNSVMIEEIQNECICFREYGYENLSGVDCSDRIIKTEKKVENIEEDNVKYYMSCHSDGCNNICCNNQGICTTTLMYCFNEEK